MISPHFSDSQLVQSVLCSTALKASRNIHRNWMIEREKAIETHGKSVCSVGSVLSHVVDAMSSYIG